MSIGLLLGLLACGPQQAEFSWDTNPAMDVDVLPVVGVFDDPVVRVDGFVTETIGPERSVRRSIRTEQLLDVPDAVGYALPGAFHAAVGEGMPARLRPARFPIGARERLEGALRGKGELDDRLADVARGLDGDATLFVWVTRLDGDPLTAEALPGEIVRTLSGPVLVDFADEAYRVHADVGFAFVGKDGTVVVKHTDELEAVLSAHSDADRVGRQMAKAMARDAALLWYGGASSP